MPKMWCLVAPAVVLGYFNRLLKCLLQTFSLLHPVAYVEVSPSGYTTLKSIGIQMPHFPEKCAVQLYILAPLLSWGQITNSTALFTATIIVLRAITNSTALHIGTIIVLRADHTQYYHYCLESKSQTVQLYLLPPLLFWEQITNSTALFTATIIVMRENHKHCSFIHCHHCFSLRANHKQYSFIYWHHYCLKTNHKQYSFIYCHHYCLLGNHKQYSFIYWYHYCLEGKSQTVQLYLQSPLLSRGQSQTVQLYLLAPLLSWGQITNSTALFTPTIGFPEGKSQTVQLYLLPPLLSVGQSQTVQLYLLPPLLSWGQITNSTALFTATIGFPEGKSKHISNFHHPKLSGNRISENGLWKQDWQLVKLYSNIHPLAMLWH